MENSVFGAAGSSPDANRLYSILLDTRASSMSQNMYDIAEKIMKNEKENAKMALEQFWSLKKNLTDENVAQTVDMLINFYQEKIDVLRSKEDHIKKVSKDSRELLEEKRKRDAEIATVKQEIDECSSEIDRLNARMRQLEVKEQELSLIDTQVEKELRLNANEVVNGLYEIIFSAQERAVTDSLPLDKELQKELNDTEPPSEHADDAATEKDTTAPGSAETVPEIVLEKKDIPGTDQDEEVNEAQVVPHEDYMQPTEKQHKPLPDDTDIFENYDGVFKKEEKKIEVNYPKSVVKTTRGTVIGEYYYDGKVYKNKRHYIYNSQFFWRKVYNALKACKEQFDQSRYNEAVQIIKDAHKRIIEKSSLHFEVSTNEILNKHVMKDLVQKIDRREYDDIVAVCSRLKAKIDALGGNYVEMLQEQMTRYSEI